MAVDDFEAPTRLASFDVAGVNPFRPRRKPAMSAPKPKAEMPPTILTELASLRAEVATLKAAPAIDPAEHAAALAELAALREEVEAIKDAPTRERQRQTLADWLRADLEWRNRVR